MFDQRRLTTEEKALKVNLTPEIYGSFAEIGAGQEVAANFFKAGGSSGTIAYTQSAYDMKVSDQMYGKCKRYVSEERLEMMLEHEFQNTVDSLEIRKDTTKFFSFCNTVESLNYHKTNQGQGWVGIRFQLTPNANPNDIILHIKMHDNSNWAQQEALGILGVNLVHAAFFHNDSLEHFLNGLVDRLPRERMEIDMIRVKGPDFENVDNRIIALNMVQKGLTEATMFGPKGDVLQPSTALYKKNVLLTRGRFRPVTHVHLDMVENAYQQFIQEDDVEKGNVELLFELTLKDLTDKGKISDSDFLDRAELLGSLGYTVMVSNYLKHYKMVDYISSFTRKRKIGLILGVFNLQTIFEPDYYTNLPGGILEAFGRGFGHNVKILVYPAIIENNGAEEKMSLENIKIKDELRGLLAYLIDNNKIEPIKNYNEEVLRISSDAVLADIKAGGDSWMTQVPEKVKKLIVKHELFGFKKKAFQNA